MTDPIKTLFEDYVIDILTYVSKNPGLTRTELYELLNSTSNKPRKLTSELIEGGLIEEIRGVRYNVKTMQLTDEGTRYLNLINAMKYGTTHEDEAINHGTSTTVLGSVTAKNVKESREI